ncbi:MAG: hypothetical protein IT222_04125, partial [Crocinitomix sp.]|nr:hypothetical protein [Crocinitomix sp.]
IFTKETSEFDFEKYVDLAQKRYQTMAFFSKNKVIESILPQTPLDKNIPILGMYGKCGEFKGTWDVLDVLKIIASKNIDFQFIYLASGTESQLYKLYNSIFESPELIGKVWILPAIPFLQVPSFIKKCDAVFVMERKAPISIHNVSTPMEILSVGTCLIVSEEVVSKSNFKNKLLSEVNSIIIESPCEHADFAKVLIENLKIDVLERIGKRGIDIFHECNENLIQHYSMATSIKDMLK